MYSQNPQITLIPGFTYIFRMESVSSIHPFYISTSPTGEGAGVYSNGVTGNNVFGNNALTFVVPMNAPAVLYYQCVVHSSMGAAMNVLQL